LRNLKKKIGTLGDAFRGLKMRRSGVSGRRTEAKSKRIGAAEPMSGEPPKTIFLRKQREGALRIRIERP